MRLKRAAMLAGALLLTACQPQPKISSLEAVYDGERYQVRLQQQRISVFDHQLQETIFSAPVSSLISAHQTVLSLPDPGASSSAGLPQEKTLRSCTQAVIDKAEPTSQFLLMTGHFSSPECTARFSLNFALEDSQLQLTMTTTDAEYNHLTLGFDAPLRETILGFGSQASLLDFKGQEVPVWARQQGVGRGEQPISTLINEHTAGVAGTDLNSEFVAPYFLSSAHYSVFLDNPEYSRFDFRQRQSTRIHSYSNTLKARLTSCEKLLECISHYTNVSGRMKPLPTWTQQGAIVGLQGGSEAVLTHYQQLKDRHVPIAALLLKDWQEVTLDGQARYPDWKAMRKTLQKDDVRLLGYITPSLTAPNPQRQASELNLYQEALDKGFLIKNTEGKAYSLLPTPFSGSEAAERTHNRVVHGVVDLTNPDAFMWLKDIIKKQAKAHHFAGWVAELDETLPMDAVLHSEQPALDFHNLFAQEWARLNHEVIAELGMEDEALLWMRYGFTQSSSLVTAFVAGEQNTSWDAHDGLQSALITLLNNGVSGQALSHTDTGGFTSLQQPVSNIAHWLLPQELTLAKQAILPKEVTPSQSSAPQKTVTEFALHRSPELLQRWTELNAFTGLLRTDEGFTPEINAQVYDSSAALEHFAHNAQLFQALAPYRRELMQEAAEHGWPLVRHPLLHFPNELYFENMPSTDLQFMLGDSVMVAPMLTPAKQRQRRQVFLPKGEWIELSTGKTIIAGKKGKMLHLTPPANQAAAYLRNNERSREVIVPALHQAGFTPAGSDPIITEQQN